MSLALCLFCGDDKSSALLPCDACHRVPASPREQAEHLLAVDEGSARRAVIIAAVRAGRPAAFEEEDVHGMMASLAEASPWRVALYALAVGGIPFLVAGLALLGLAWLLMAL